MSAPNPSTPEATRNCKRCSDPVRRFSARGNPYVYCSGECDRADTAERRLGKKFGPRKVSLVPVRRLPVIADSDYGKWRDYLSLPTSVTQDEACLFLEAKGYRFLVDYGYENAVEKAERFPHFGQRGQA